MEFLNDLNQQQQQVVTTTSGPVLVLAGAGSGKTRCVIYRAAYLIKQLQISPWQILVVTFTNKAARELINRLENTFALSARSLWIGTFHSICSRILRSEKDYLQYTAEFSIYDEDDQKVLFRKIYKQLDIDAEKFPPARVRAIISNQKNSLIRVTDFFDFNEHNYFSDQVHKIYEYYQKSLLKNNAMDFDDLLINAVFLLHDHPELLAKYQAKFSYVMIDEYQDTNYAQFKFVNLIASRHRNLCVVGDDDQAIYSWRGADIRNILNFERDYGNVTTIRLERNYRSPRSILALAHSLIIHNQSRHSKQLWTDKPDDSRPRVVRLENENEEAGFIASEVTSWQERGNDLNQCVVLYRTNAQSRVFENVFIRNRIKYQIVGGVNFYQRKEIKDIMAYLRVLINQQDSESLLRILNFPPRGIGQVTAGTLLELAVSNGTTLFDTIMNRLTGQLPPQQMKKVKEFAALIRKWQESITVLALPDLIKEIIDDLQLLELYENSKDPQDISRLENLEEFIAATEEFQEDFLNEKGEQPGLTDFLQQVSLQTDLDNMDEAQYSVKLMTMHNAKGLEFDNVFVVGLEDNLLPHSRSLESDSDLEEERRLFYVAMTRARKNLTITHARTRRFYDTSNLTLPSRFLRELDKELYDFIDKSIKNSDNFNQFRIIPLNKPRENEKYFKIGQKIAHSKFGKGVILNVDGTGKDAKLTISFAGGHLKKIIGTFVEVV
ncbi:MAG: UvrD-helicase domain-containing protein [Candidatus Cloacimonetes bacterium]|nr:UvrD-helicase domain-containing protein [Candidatus Cloacimonadota bacterium]